MTKHSVTEGGKCPCGKSPEQCKGWENGMAQLVCPLKPRYQPATKEQG